MRSLLLVALISCLCFVSKAQDQDSIDVVTKAETWFRSTYVEDLFKDPYSYRLVKISATPVSRAESIQDSISLLNRLIEENAIPARLRTAKERQEWQELYDESIIHVNKFDEDVKNGKEISNFDDKRNEIYKEAARDALEKLTAYKLLELDIAEHGRLRTLQSNLTDAEMAELSHYLIKLDCYSKNSLGNEVLGRFSFPFTAEGVLGSGDGFSNVIQLNK